MRKDIEIDYTKDEFIKKYSIKKNDFKNDISTFLNYFYLDKEILKRDSNEEGNYEIPYEIGDLLSLMFKNFKNSPFYDKRYNLDTKNTELTLNYINQILSEVENLPDYLKYTIKKNPTYSFNSNLNEIIPILINKFTALLVLIGSKSTVSAGNQLLQLIKELDMWIDNYCLSNHMSELAKASDIHILDIDDTGNLHPHGKYEYNIDTVLSSCLNEHLKKYTGGLPSNIPDTLKDKLLNLTKKGEKKRKLTESELIQLRKEYDKFLNTFIDKETFSRISTDINNEQKKLSNLNFIYPKHSINEIKQTLSHHFTIYNSIKSSNFVLNKNAIINSNSLLPYGYNKKNISGFKINNINVISYLERIYEASNKDLEYSQCNINYNKNFQEEIKKCASEIFNLEKCIYDKKESLFKEINSDSKYLLIKQLLNNQLAQILFLSMK